jgi:hypothetical protein
MIRNGSLVSPSMVVAMSCEMRPTFMSQEKDCDVAMTKKTMAELMLALTMTVRRVARSISR